MTRLILAAFAVVSISCSGPTSPNPISVKSIIVSGPTEIVGLGNTIQLSAQIVYSDGTTIICTNTCGWISAIPGVATVSKGLVLSRNRGSSRISAYLQGIEGGLLIVVR
jgi:hypothetical protein